MEILKHIKKVINKYENTLIILYLMAMLIIKLPSFYILFSSRFTSTLTFAKITILFSFVAFILMYYTKNVFKRVIFYLLLALLITHSLSIFNATNELSFLRQYQNLVLSIVIFISAYLTIQSTFLKKNILKYIYIVAVITICIELFFLLTPDSFIILFKSILPIQKELLDLYLYNYYNLERFNLYLNSELFIPFFLYGLFNKKYNQKVKILSLIGVIILFILTLSSKFRSRLLQAVFAVISYILLIKMSFSKILYIVIFCVLFFLGFILFSFASDHTIFDRILKADSREDDGTVNFRFRQLEYASYLANAYPFFGVGLGNYKEYTDLSKGLGISDYYQKEHFIATQNTPHSIISEVLSETGILGTTSYFLVITYFFVKDCLYYKKNKDSDEDPHLPFIISSWTIFVYGLINPFSSVFLNGWFWFLRGILEGNIYNKKEK